MNITFKHSGPISNSVEFYKADSIKVLEKENGEILIGRPHDTPLRDLIYVVNFQLGYELLRHI